MTVKVSSSAPAALSCQRSHKPAKPYGSPDFNAIANGFLVLVSIFCHSRKASAGTRHRLLLNASRNEGAVATVSALALMVESPICGSFAQYAVWDKTPTHHHDLALASIAIEADD